MVENKEDKLVIEKIRAIKARLGQELLILTHHYQRIRIVELGHYRGDSFDLSQRAAANQAARYIVFCGVHFMAESAAILAKPHQTVQIPAVEAGCWMADMADHAAVGIAWEELTAVLGRDSVTPVVYMNSDAELKAFCGREGGLVCTSSNAARAFRWALEQRERVFFFPDQHLGRNTARDLGIPPEQTVLWRFGEPLGGNTLEDLRKSKLVLWDGYCLVHTRFKVEHMAEMRRKYPGARIVVHPECTQAVVGLADAVGSTRFIVEYVEKAPPRATIIVGTEINLVQRLAKENPDKQVLELHPSLCPNMYKINPENLLWTLEHCGQVNVVTVEASVKREARVALDRMLNLPP